MTQDKARKAAIRQRMAATGEPYSEARHAVERDREAAAGHDGPDQLDDPGLRWEQARERAEQAQQLADAAQERFVHAEEAAMMAQDAADRAQDFANEAEELACAADSAKYDHVEFEDSEVEDEFDDGRVHWRYRVHEQRSWPGQRDQYGHPGGPGPVPPLPPRPPEPPHHPGQPDQSGRPGRPGQSGRPGRPDQSGRPGRPGAPGRPQDGVERLLGRFGQFRQRAEEIVDRAERILNLGREESRPAPAEPDSADAGGRAD